MKTITLFIMLSSFCFGQSEKKIKSTREKIIFLNDSIQNYKLFEWDGDYGHSGFLTPDGTISRFHQNWYNEYLVHYLNNARNYNDKGLLISEDWYNKKDEKIASFYYNYSEFDSLTSIKEKDPFDDDIMITDITYNHKNFKRSELRHWSNDSQNFSLKLIDYDESGTKKIKEAFYSEEGYYRSSFYLYDNEKSKYIIKDHIPSVWSRYDEKSFYQKPDSLGTSYIKQMQYKNDKKQIDKILYFSEPDYNSDSILTRKEFRKYDNFNNIIELRSTFSNSDSEFIYLKKYDNENKLIWENDGFGIEKEYFYDKNNRFDSVIQKTRLQNPDSSGFCN